MPSEGVVPDCVFGFVAEPVGQGPVLPLLLGQSLLNQQALMGSH